MEIAVHIFEETERASRDMDCAKTLTVREDCKIIDMIFVRNGYFLDVDILIGFQLAELLDRLVVLGLVHLVVFCPSSPFAVLIFREAVLELYIEDEARFVCRRNLNEIRERTDIIQLIIFAYNVYWAIFYCVRNDRLDLDTISEEVTILDERVEGVFDEADVGAVYSALLVCIRTLRMLCEIVHRFRNQKLAEETARNFCAAIDVIDEDIDRDIAGNSTDLIIDVSHHLRILLLGSGADETFDLLDITIFHTFADIDTSHGSDILMIDMIAMLGGIDGRVNTNADALVLDVIAGKDVCVRTLLFLDRIVHETEVLRTEFF